MRYRLIVWDFDGTLANSMVQALTVINDVAVRHGFERVDLAAFRNIRNIGMRAFLKQHKISLVRVPFLLKEVRATARRNRIMEEIRLFDGLPAILHSVKARGYRQGVLSSNSADNIRVCLQTNAVEKEFDFVVGDIGLFGKTKAIRRLLKKESVEQKNFLYIGDEVSDVKAAKQAGVDIAAVGWGFNTLELLSRQSPTYLWSCPDEVLSALSREDRELYSSP